MLQEPPGSWCVLSSCPWVLATSELRRTDGVSVRADVPAHDVEKSSRIIDLDVDIGADAVDYKYVPRCCALLSPPFLTFFFLASTFLSAIANQESLSGLETEMRKLEGVVKEIVDEMDYLKRREERFLDTNGKY